VSDLKVKEKLIKETAKNKYTVAKLRERIAELKEKKEPVLSLEEIPTLPYLRSLDVNILKHNEQKAKDAHDFHHDKAEHYKRVQKKITSAINDVETIASQSSQEIQAKGFYEWTKPGNIVNICFGCSNDCVYCFNRAPSYWRGWIKAGHWKDEALRPKEISAKRKLYNGRVAFPTTHDITKKNLKDYITVLGKLLKAGNEVLIVSKPRLDCIKAVCSASAFFKDEILFRFTIGATDDKILKLWEPNAPSYAERKECLKFAYDQKFKTSVSVEPMLDSPNIKQLVKELKPFVNDAIWIGTLNHTNEIAKTATKEILDALKVIEENQAKEKIQAIYDFFKDDPKIKWKDKIKSMMGLEKPPAQGMDI
jgi:DNA repair photolyase